MTANLVSQFSNRLEFHQEKNICSQPFLERRKKEKGYCVDFMHREHIIISNEKMLNFSYPADWTGIHTKFTSTHFHIVIPMASPVKCVGLSIETKKTPVNYEYFHATLDLDWTYDTDDDVLCHAKQDVGVHVAHKFMCSGATLQSRWCDRMHLTLLKCPYIIIINFIVSVIINSMPFFFLSSLCCPTMEKNRFS